MEYYGYKRGFVDLGAFLRSLYQKIRKATYVKFILGICVEDKITRYLDIDQNH